MLKLVSTGSTKRGEFYDGCFKSQYRLGNEI